MPLQFDTTHEYYLNDPSVYYAECCNTLVAYDSNQGQENYIRIAGFDAKDILMMARNFFSSEEASFLKVKDAEVRDKFVKEIHASLDKYLKAKKLIKTATTKEVVK